MLAQIAIQSDMSVQGDGLDWQRNHSDAPDVGFDDALTVDHKVVYLRRRAPTDTPAPQKNTTRPLSSLFMRWTGIVGPFEINSGTDRYPLCRPSGPSALRYLLDCVFARSPPIVVGVTWPLRHRAS